MSESEVSVPTQDTYSPKLTLADVIMDTQKLISREIMKHEEHMETLKNLQSRFMSICQNYESIISDLRQKMNKEEKPKEA